jgi:hypothetical protein
MFSDDRLGPVTSQLQTGKPIKITYPRFWQTPDGGLQSCYRRGGSGNGDRMLVDYDGQTGAWVNTRQIDSGKGLFKDSMGDNEIIQLHRDLSLRSGAEWRNLFKQNPRLRSG